MRSVLIFYSWKFYFSLSQREKADCREAPGFILALTFQIFPG